jgi:hypothetical protein
MNKEGQWWLLFSRSWFFCVCGVSRGLQAGQTRPDGSVAGLGMSDGELTNLIV